MSKTGLKRRRRIGYVVFSTLVGFKVIEYLITTLVHQGGWPYLAVLALAGAWLVYHYFMHINQLWRTRSRDDE